MGKASRLKAERGAARRAKDVSGPEGKTPEEELGAAALVVGELFGTQADCAAAAGLLVEIAKHLGYSLRPRPVAALIRDRATNSFIAMGPKATKKLNELQPGKVENHLPDGRDTGHIVVTSNDYRLMLDPNMRQLAGYGINAQSVGLRVNSVDPESGEWEYSDGTLDILYFVDDGNQTLIPRYEDARRESAAYAKVIAEGLRKGVNPVEIAARMKKNCSAVRIAMG